MALKEIHDALCQHYELISQAFLFYPTGSSADVFHMGLNNFTALLEDCKVCLPPQRLQLDILLWSTYCMPEDLVA